MKASGYKLIYLVYLVRNEGNEAKLDYFYAN